MKLPRARDRTFLVAIGGVLIGSAILVLGSNLPRGWLSTLLVNSGSFVIASVAMALIFEFWQLRTLLEDLYDHARITTQLRQAKLAGFSVAFHDGVPWEQLFADSSSLRMMVAYAATWRNSQQTRLEAFLAKPGSVLEVVLPNPGVEQVVAELATRFGASPSDLAARIQEAVAFFQDLQSRANGVVRVFLYGRAPHYTFYLFDRRAVFTTYRHRPGRGPILTLLADRGGEMYTWLRDECESLVGDEALKANLLTSLITELPPASNTAGLIGRLDSEGREAR